MQDFETPFNPLGGAPITVSQPGAEPVQLQPNCCGNVCSDACIVQPTPPTPYAKDTDLVTLEVPIRFQPGDPTKEGEPILDGQTQIGQDCGGKEITAPLVLTVGQLKALFLSEVLVRGNYADTRQTFGRIQAALAQPSV